MNEKPIPASTATIQASNWSGCIPIILSLAPSSLSSPAKPRPLHKMISRMNYLHVALCEEVMQLLEYAPATTCGKMLVGEEPPDDEDGNGDNINSEVSAAATDEMPNASNNVTNHENETTSETNSVELKQIYYPTCWFEDEESGEPLRWHLFIGVLYDAMKGRAIVQNSLRVGFTGESVAPTLLPWRIRVHFTAYPTTLLPFSINITNTKEDLDTASETNTEVSPTHQISASIGRIFRNSLKQALFMQYSSSKIAMSITKSSHEKMWDALLTTNYTLYHGINCSLQIGVSADENAKDKVPDLIPVRIMLNCDSPMQKPCRAYGAQDSAKEPSTIKGEDNTEESNQGDTDDTTEDGKALDSLVEKLTAYSVKPQTSLEDVLTSWLPQYFERNAGNDIVAKTPVHYSIQGMQPKLSCSILELWKALCHPDHFLYVVVVTKI